MIQAAAQALRTYVRQCDVVARVGGDEFIIAFVHCSVEDANSIFERVKSELRQVGQSNYNDYWSLNDGLLPYHKRGSRSINS